LPFYVNPGLETACTDRVKLVHQQLIRKLNQNGSGFSLSTFVEEAKIDSRQEDEVVKSVFERFYRQVLKSPNAIAISLGDWQTSWKLNLPAQAKCRMCN
jgi:hypothetical protein